MTRNNPIIISIIPARGGSKGVPKKNIRFLGDKPLIAHAIEASLESKLVQRTLVSTESEEIAEISRKFGAEIIKRPNVLAQDETPDLPVFQHVINTLEKKDDYFPDILVHLRCTSPFRTTQDIDNAVQKMIDTNADGVRTVNQVTETPFWMDIIEGQDILKSFIPGGRKYTRRQDLPKIYRANGLVDVVRRNIVMDKNCMYAEDNQRAVITETERSIEIDTELEFFLCEQLIKENFQTFIKTGKIQE